MKDIILDFHTFCRSCQTPVNDGDTVYVIEEEVLCEKCNPVGYTAEWGTQQCVEDFPGSMSGVSFGQHILANLVKGGRVEGGWNDYKDKPFVKITVSSLEGKSDHEVWTLDGGNWSGKRYYTTPVIRLVPRKEEGTNG